MYHWGGEEQWCKGSSLFALLLLPRHVRPRLSLLVLGHFFLKMRPFFDVWKAISLSFSPLLKNIASLLFCR